MLDDRLHQEGAVKSADSHPSGFHVLIASRSGLAAEKLKELAVQADEVDVTVRLISNGHTDPLYGLDSYPDLLIFHLGECWQDELESLCERPAAQRPPLLVISSAQDPQAMRLAMKAGARDFFLEPVLLPDLVSAIDTLNSEARDKPASYHAKLTVIMNAKGGSGASLIASNLAHLMAEVSKEKVALIDMDFQFGSLSHYLDLNPVHGIKQALTNIDELDSTALQGYLLKHTSGLRVMGSEQGQLMLPDEISSDQLAGLLDLMSENHDHLIVDLPRQIDVLTTTVLEHADNIIIVLQQGITHLRDAVRLISVLRNDLDISDRQITVVLNRFEKNASITIDEVEKALKHKPVITIPNDYKHVSACINDGTPLYSIARKAPITQSLLELETRIAGLHEEKHKGMFGRIFSKMKGV